ncbi:transcriptional regulator protein Pur-beta-like [Oscarella lobularis]|uniref:transcriptional regulator protein Pur-beta-like n=1 Tax=Oscarella lobularis TaxID=121494 RepID=UPI00331442A7
MAERVGARESESTEEGPDLASRQFHIQSKRFYVDVKQNPRGRYLKISEISQARGRDRITFPMSHVPAFRDHMRQYVDYLSENEAKTPDGGVLKQTDYTANDRRKIFFELRENERGRFLRIFYDGNYGTKSSVAIPGSGVSQIHEAICSLVEELGSEDHALITQDTVPDSLQFLAEGKKFYFDPGSNQRGVFLRISEVQRSYRNSITIPHSAWEEFRDMLTHFIEQMPYQGPSSRGDDLEDI